MILTEIKDKLTELDPNVYYGMVYESAMHLPWDYIVFNRTKLSSNQNKTSFSDYFEIHVVRENFIPDGIGDQVIEKMLEINGMRLTSDDGIYTYVQKPKTDQVVEMLTLTFVRARK